MKLYTDQEILDAMRRAKGTEKFVLRDWLQILPGYLPDISKEQILKAFSRMSGQHILAVTPKSYGVRPIPVVEVEA